MVALPLCSLEGVKDILYFSERRCGIGRRQLVCAADGKLRPCTHFDIVEGDLMNEDLSQIWERLKHWIEAEHIPDICLNCKLFGICGGGCRMSAKKATGNHCEVDPNVNIESIDKIVVQIQEQLRNRQTVVEALPDFFVVNKYRVRKEEWGAVIDSALGKSRTVLISNEAFLVLKSFDVGRTYATCEVMQDIPQVDRANFLIGMANRGVLRFV